MKTLMYAALLSILYISIGKSADFYYYQSQKIKIDRVAGFQAVRMASGMDSTTVRRHLSAVRPHKVFQIYKDIYFIETDREIQPDFSVIEVIPVYQNGLVKLVPTSQLIIEFLSSQSIQTVISRYHLKPVQYLNPVTVVVSTDLPADQIITLADEIALLPQVKFAEPNFIRLMPTFSIDPYFLSQWYLENRGGSPAYGVPDADIDAPEAWEISRGSPDIVIAIMDMGVDLQHPDLQENLVVGFDTYDNDNDPSPDRHESHGTCCAGLAAAVTDNNIGIAGVAPECNIMPVRIGTTVSENDPSIIATNAQIANGIDRAWQNGADILSHSWGGGSPSSTITAAIERAKTQGRDGKGCVILFASGNDNTAVDWPATLNSVIAVGATNEDDDRCSSVDWGWGSGSNYGDELDIVAPGNYLYTTDNRGQDGYSPTDYYAYFGGTSGSVPIAAGVAGLVLSVNPDLTSDQVQEVLQNTADDQVGRTNEDTQGCDRYHGHGRINAFQALLSLQEECAITLLEPNGGESLMPFTVITIRWTSFHSTGYVDISLSLDAGANWTEIVTATEDDGQYKWTVLDTPSDLCLVRVSANGDSACSDQSDAPFSIQNNRFIRLVAPNGGESWPEKSIRQIVWESDGIDGNVSIDYSIDLGENWKSVGSAPAAQAGFVWTIPEVTATVNSCLLRLVTLQTPVKTDVSDGPFSIVDVEPDCDITLLIPNGGELWPAGSEQVIIWDPGIIQLPVDISYSNNNGLSYKLFAENEYNDGCYLWTIPQDISGPAMIKIVRSTNEVCFDLSDAIFYLDNAPVPAIQVNNIKGLSGDIITTEIGLVKSNTLVDAFGFDVVYDADHLQLSAVEKGDLTQDWIQFQGQEVEAGRIRIGGFNMNAIESDVSGALARLHFQVICDFCDSCSTSRLLIQSVRDDIQYYNVWNGTFRYATHCKLGDINMDGVLTPGDAQCAFQM
ncbi:S8 family serine peptidase, partial [candidate division KSB1 bacterium]|nr:S8 family serine peptidase [candidate division KSB1 bacterium]